MAGAVVAGQVIALQTGAAAESTRQLRVKTEGKYRKVLALSAEGLASPVGGRGRAGAEAVRMLLIGGRSSCN